MEGNDGDAIPYCRSTGAGGGVGRTLPTIDRRVQYIRSASSHRRVAPTAHDPASFAERNEHRIGDKPQETEVADEEISDFRGQNSVNYRSICTIY